MKNFQFSDLLTYVTKNILLFAYCSNVANIKAYFDKNSAKNEILQKMVFRFSDTLMTDKQKSDNMTNVLSNVAELPNLKNGSLQLVYNDYFKQSILLVNNTFALMCNVSTLTTPEAKNAYNETLLSLFLHLAQPHTVTVDAKQIAKTLFTNTPYPCGKQYINSLKYLSSDVQSEFIALNDGLVPCKNETTFFSFAPKVEKPVPTKTTAKVETPTSTPTAKKTVKTLVEKMQVVYEVEKIRINALPKTKTKIGEVKQFDAKSIETVCSELHQASELKNASMTAFLNSEITKINA